MSRIEFHMSLGQAASGGWRGSDPLKRNSGAKMKAGVDGWMDKLRRRRSGSVWMRWNGSMEGLAVGNVCGKVDR